MIVDAENYRIHDMARKNAVFALNDLQAFCGKLKNPKNVSE